jgi:hypothetical protein
MPYKDITEHAFGQLGSAYLSDTSAYTPPSGKIVIAITFLQDTKFTALLSENFDPPGSTGVGSVQHTLAYTGVHGTNADAINDNTVFPRGITIYGRWSTLTLGSGQVIMYFGVEKPAIQ